MGSVIPSIISIALEVVGGVSKTQQKSSAASAQSDAIVQQQQADEDSRQRALKAAMATQRARFGASGVGAEDGSAEAVLLGLFQSSEEEANARLERDSLRLRAVNQGANYSYGQNLLSTTQDVLNSNFRSTFLS